MSRKCSWPTGCGTVLSDYNKGDLCSVHLRIERTRSLQQDMIWEDLTVLVIPAKLEIVTRNSIDGIFQAGDIVSVKNECGSEIARGLINYSSEELSQIMGKKTSEVRAILKSNFFEEAIHRDNMAILIEDSK